MTTEVALLPLRPDLDKSVDLTRCEAYRDTIRTLKQQHGFQRVYWGTEKADPGMLRFFVDWDSVEDHIAFTKSEIYSSFMDRFGEVVDMDRGQLYHVQARPHPPLVLSDRVAPVTAIWAIVFPTDYSRKAQDKLEQDVQGFLAAMEEEQVYKGSAGGWVLEDIEVPVVSGRVKVFQVFIGWESLQAAEQFQKTSTFKEAVAPIEKANELLMITIAYYTGILENGTP